MNRERDQSLFKQRGMSSISRIRIYSLLMLLTNNVQIHSNIRVQSNRDIKKLERRRGFLDYLSILQNSKNNLTYNMNWGFKSLVFTDCAMLNVNIETIV